jgi:hypothetical protein
MSINLVYLMENITKEKDLYKGNKVDDYKELFELGFDKIIR